MHHQNHAMVSFLSGWTSAPGHLLSLPRSLHPTTAINNLCRPHAFRHPLKSDARLVGRAWVTCPHVLGPTSRKRGNIQPSGCCDGRQAGLSRKAVYVTFSGLSGESLVWSQLHGSACGLQTFYLPQSVHSDYIAFFPHHQLHVWGMDKNWFSFKILRASCGVCTCGMEQIKILLQT